MIAQAVAAIALGLLGASGVAKLIDPEPTTGAMDLARLPSSHTISRLLGGTEIVVAVTALATGWTPAGVVACGLYLAFAVFTFSAVRNRIPLQSCGCFGREDTPPNAVHVAYNLAATAALGVVAAAGLSPIDWGLPAIELALFGGFTVIGVYASYLLMTRLPQLLDLARTS